MKSTHTYDLIIDEALQLRVRYAVAEDNDALRPVGVLLVVGFEGLLEQECGILGLYNVKDHIAKYSFTSYVTRDKGRRR